MNRASLICITINIFINNSGKMKVSIDEDCIKTFNDLKFRKIEAQYIIYELVKDPTSEHIKISSIGAKGKTWNEFLAQFPPNEPRFSIFDVEFVNGDGMNISKLVFVYWLPDTVPLKARVTYAASKETLRSQTGGLKEFSISAINDRTFEEITKELDK